VTAYAELQVTTSYSFLRGASHPEELFAQARLLGLPVLGITDRNSFAGIVACHQRAEEAGVRMLVGCRLDLTDGTSLLVYPQNRPGYSRLCRLLSLGKIRAGKGGCDLAWQDVAAHGDEQLAVLLPDQPDDALRSSLARLRADFGDRGYLALTLRRRPGDAVRLHWLAEAAAAARIPTVATGDVLYHAPQRRVLQDVMTCIREGCTIDEAGFRRERFADRYLRPPEEMARLFARHPDAVARTLEIVDRCPFDLRELRYQYPAEIEDPALTPQQTLEKLTWEGAVQRFPEGVPDDVAAQLGHELMLIAELEYAPYFLTVNNIVRFARSKNILCQGRGSAANSAVCYVLGITSIDPVRGGLLFERFVSAERREPPDIDVDFEHERREEVIQWVYETYGRDRAALCATIIRYRARSAVREVGKAMGLTEDVTSALASQLWGWSEEGVPEEQAAELNLNLADRRLRLTLELSRQLIGFPRHLSQHPGGFVLTHDRLDELVPIEPAAMEDRQVIEWDKDDIDYLRFMKVDVLGLGMLSCIRRAFDLLHEHRGLRLDLASIPAEDRTTYAMIQIADTLGTFQIESRAQMSMLPRLKPATFYDLVIEVAIVRPGPIQGDMVHPYLRRREGKDPVEYPTPELRRVLGKTLGVPLFQEQAMQVAIVCAGFTATEADALRRSMATFKMTGGVSKFQAKMIDGMMANGYVREFAERTFKQIEGFGSYGFPESHAASFALIAYASCWLKCHHPDVFCAALLNAQPLGFYAPAQIVRDAEKHGVEVRPVCINASQWDCSLEPAGGKYLAVRLGLRIVKGLTEAHAATLIAHRCGMAYRSIEDVRRRAAVPVAALEQLADADAFLGLSLARRQALWAIRGLDHTELPLMIAAGPPVAPAQSREPKVKLRRMPAGGEVVADYRSVGLTLRQHPVSFVRDEIRRLGAVPCAALPDLTPGKRVTVAGIVLVRQRPGSAKGVVFATIEDETGHANIIVWPNVFERQRRIVLAARMIACRGLLQRESDVIHIVADELTDLSDLLASVGQRNTPFPLLHGRGDQVTHGSGPDSREVLGRKPRDIYIRDIHMDTLKVKSRDFH
jgi:error-prone DNA polymerase